MAKDKNNKQMMHGYIKVIDIKPRGYCRGVVQALLLIKRVREEHPDETISVLGKIVHNEYVTAAMDLYNIKTIDFPGQTREELLSHVDHGIVILSAHGSSNKVKKLAEEKGLRVFDAACSDVISTHQIISDSLLNHKKVIFIGKDQHPETEAVITNFPDVYLITKEEDIGQLSFTQDDEIVIANQTTLSILDMQELIEAIIKKFPQADVVDEVCGATRVRQEAVIKHSDLDALVVIGDPRSNNTAMLAKIGLDSGIKSVQRIETIQDLDLSVFKKGDKVGVTSGASTPPYLTDMVSKYLKQVDLDNPSPKPEIEIDKIIDF